MDKQNSEVHVELHCTIHQHSLRRRPFQVKTCYESCGVACDLQRHYGLNHRRLQSFFLSEIEVEYEDVLYYTEV
jgi:hypothetical protein